jgi:3'-5' exonuclease
MSYQVFDIETIPNVDLLRRLYPDFALESDSDMVAELESEEFFGKDGKRGFIPATMQTPVSIVVASIDRSMLLRELEVVPSAIDLLLRPGTFVSYNGRRFDMPVLEHELYTKGVAAPIWFGGNKSWDQPRNRYNTSFHWDCADFQTNFGAGGCHGGLNLLAKQIGAAGKMDVDGSSVWGLWESGELDTIHDYCKCDVIDTYCVFLRQMLVKGEISRSGHTAAIRHLMDTMEFITSAWAKRWSSAADWSLLLMGAPEKGEIPA